MCDRKRDKFRFSCKFALVTAYVVVAKHQPYGHIEIGNIDTNSNINQEEK